MAASHYMAAFLILALISESNSQPIIQIYQKTPRSVPTNLASSDDDMYCNSWRFSVETNDAGKWSGVPKRCLDYVKEYMSGDGFRSDSEFVADNSVEFAKTVKVAGNGKDAWVFDIDETLVSNLPYHAAHGYGSNAFDEKSFNEWVGLGEAPALPASLRLYKELEEMGITIFLLTGKSFY